MNYSYSFIYRQRRVFSRPGPGGVHYVELSELGSGTYGVVLCCRRIESYGVFDREPIETGNVAVKVIAPWYPTSMNIAWKEAQALRVLGKIPGFISMQDYWADEALRESCEYRH